MKTIQTKTRGRCLYGGLLGGALIASLALSTAHAAASDCVAAESRLAATDSALNRCPVANAGIGLPVYVGETIVLDGAGSNDADGQRLGFEWKRVSAPAGSAAVAADPRAVRTAFTTDLAGHYVFELAVTDAAGARAVDTVRFSTGNIAPKADAGPDIAATVGELVSLDAMRSFDANDQALSYRWELTSRPADSSGALHARNQATSSLFIDAEGDYEATLIVSDGKIESVADTVRISTTNTAPMALTGSERSYASDSTVTLNGIASLDANGDALSYSWSILSSPQASAVTLKDAYAESTTAVVDIEGQYLFQLIVDDGELQSQPRTMLVTVRNDRLQDIDLNHFLGLTQLGGGDDTDGDGVLDPVDNCVLAANPAQQDTDSDGLGNACDQDLNNDGAVNFGDLALLKAAFFPVNNPDADFNGDGLVNFGDLVRMKAAFLKPPGPAGTTVWISLVDGDWNNRLNWQPQVIPAFGTHAIANVAPDVVITVAGAVAEVKNLTLDEDMIISTSGITATGTVEASRTITASFSTISNTLFVPSQAGAGTITLNSGTHTWTGNTLGLDTLLNNGALINNSNGMTVDATLTVDAPSSPTGVQFSNSQTLGGTGTIVLDGAGNSQVSEPRLLPATSTTLTINGGLTIRGGKGTIGQSFATLVLHASVDADVNAETLVVAASTWSGTATLSATNGGALLLVGSLDNGGNTIGLDTGGGSITLQNGAGLKNATISGQPGSDITIASGTTTFDNLVLNADFNMLNGALTNVSNGLTLNGDGLIFAPTSPTGLQFLNTQTLAGTGTITIDGTGNSVISEARILPSTSTSLTVGPGITIQGGNGQVGQAFAALVLHGPVLSNVSGQILLIAGSTWSMDNTFTAANGGALQLSGTFNNGGNTMTIDGVGGTVNLLINASLRNATINTTAGTNLTVNTGATTFESLTYNGEMTHVDGALTNVMSGLTVNGIMNIDAPFSPTGLQFINSQTLGGTVNIIFDGSGNSVISEPRLLPSTSTTLTVGAGVTITGGKATVGQSFASLVFLGKLNANVAGEPIAIGGSSWSANNSMQAINDGEIHLFGAMNNGGGALALDTGNGVFNLLNGATLANAIFNGAAGTTLTVLSGATTMNGMTFNHNLVHANGALTNVSGGLTINGTSTIVAPTSPTGYQFIATQSLLGNATIVFDASANSVISEPRLFPSTSTTLTIGPGVLIRGGKGTIGQAFASLVLQGKVDADVNGQTLQFRGSLWTGTGILAANNGGILELGGTLNNADQAITVDTDGGSAQALNGAAFRNAILNGTAGTNISFPAGSFTFEDLTVNGDLTLDNGALINVTDGLTLNGTATINAPSSPTGMQFLNNQTLGGVATIVFNGIGNSVATEPRLFPATSTTLTIGSDVDIRGGVGTIGQAFATLIINGSISADTGNLTAVGNSVQSNGLLEALNGHVLTMDNLATVNSAIHSGPGSSVTSLDPLTLGPAAQVSLDVDGLTSIGRLSTPASLATYDGTLNVSAINGYSPAVNDGFAILQHSGFSGAFSTVNSFGLGGGQSFTMSYGPTVGVATVTN